MSTKPTKNSDKGHLQNTEHLEGEPAPVHVQRPAHFLRKPQAGGGWAKSWTRGQQLR